MKIKINAAIRWVKASTRDMADGIRAFRVPIWRSVIRDREPLYYAMAVTVCSYLPYGGKVLDIGTGTGRLPQLIKWTNPNLTPIGIDINETMLRHAQNEARILGLSNGEWALTRANSRYLPFADSSFDMAISMMSIYQWADRQGSCNEIYRVLKTGSVALIIVGGTWMQRLTKGENPDDDSRMLLRQAGFSDVITLKFAQRLWQPWSIEFRGLCNQSIHNGVLLTVGLKRTTQSLKCNDFTK